MPIKTFIEVQVLPTNNWAIVVAQLAEKSLPESAFQNPVNYFELFSTTCNLQKTEKLRRKRPGISHLKKCYRTETI